MMRRSVAALLLSFGFWCFAHAQVPLTGAGLGTPASGFVCPNSYCGPGDIASSALGFWSAGRAYSYSFAQSTAAIADLVDTSTGLLTCTMKIATSGFADLTSTVCPTGVPTMNVPTWCTTVSGCSITKLYDQTGNGNHLTQATLADMPSLTVSAQNSLPCPAGTGASGLGLNSTTFPSQSAPYSVFAVAERTGSTSTSQWITGNSNSANNGEIFFGTANNILVNNGAQPSLTANDNAFHAIAASFSGTLSQRVFAIDSSANKTTAANGSNAISNGKFYFMNAAGTPILSGFACEETVWGSAQTANYVNLLANMRSATYGWNF